MLNTYTVCFFGHREVSQPYLVDERIEEIVRDIVKKADYAEFLVGRDGDFDIMATSAIQRAVKKYACGNTALVLVLPYMKAEFRDNEENFYKFYDEIEICEESANAHYKSAITIRNKTMIERSDLSVFYVERKSGGAYKALQYAKKQQKEIINIAEDQF